MHHIIPLISLIFTFVEISFAVQCNTNPCQLGGDFTNPNYQCIQLPNDFNTVICTCPDGQTQTNARCRICDTVNCGPTGVCIEQSFFEGLFYACGCSNSTSNYLNPGPCPDANPTTTTTTTPTTIICLNGGIYNIATSTCICPIGFAGSYCEIPTDPTSCQNVLCANGGVCNSVSTIENGVDMQCICLNGFAGPNCELIGTRGRCTPGLCQNGGACEEKINGASVYAYCRCPDGITGQCCESRYFSCPITGVYADPVNCKFGRYFQCAGSSLSTLFCSRGLRYNFMKMRCDSDVSCPP